MPNHRDDLGESIACGCGCGTWERQVNALLDFGFVDNRENLVFIGPPGVGKTHLTIGIARKALEAGYKVAFRNALTLVEELELAEMKGELKKKISHLARFLALTALRVALARRGEPRGVVMRTDRGNVYCGWDHPEPASYWARSEPIFHKCLLLLSIT